MSEFDDDENGNIIKDEDDSLEGNYLSQEETEKIINESKNLILPNNGKIAPTKPENIEENNDENISEFENIKNENFDDEINIEVSEKDLSLVAEFASFLKKEADLIPDVGIKGVIPSGINVLDSFAGSGFAMGNLSTIVGLPGCGKSMLSAQILGNAQRTLKTPLVHYFDSEHAMSTKRLSRLGVRYPETKPYADFTVEKIFKFIETLCLFKIDKKMINKPSVMIWDSLANSKTEKEKTLDDPSQAPAIKARILGHLIPIYLEKMCNYNITMIVINQLKSNIKINSYQAGPDLKFRNSEKMMPGGSALAYNSFQLLEMFPKEYLKRDEWGFDGVKVECEFIKNKLFTPRVRFNIIGSYVHGFSNFWTNYNFMVESKRLISKGAWWSFLRNPEIKFQRKNIVNLYKTDPNFKKVFDENAKECIETEIIKKYS